MEEDEFDRYAGRLIGNFKADVSSFGFVDRLFVWVGKIKISVAAALRNLDKDRQMTRDMYEAEVNLRAATEKALHEIGRQRDDALEALEITMKGTERNMKNLQVDNERLRKIINDKPACH